MKIRTKSINIMRYVWLSLGCVCLFLGTIGIVLPILPTVPFYMVTVFCFAKGSKKIHRWFISTNLYKKHLASFAKHKALPLKTKRNIILMVTVMMGLAFIFMPSGLIAGRVLISIVWVVHLIYLLFVVRTKY